jgi:hypothetical protein
MRRNAFSTLLTGACLAGLRRGVGAVAFFGALGLAACGNPPGSFDVDEPTQTKLANLEALVQFKKPGPQPDPTDNITCPAISILDGTADDRVYGKGDQTNANLRYQFSINDIARDCHVDNGQMSLRIGVAGKVLLGPVGAPGNYAAPIRVAIIRRANDEPIASKLYQLPVGIPTGSSEAPFTLIADDLVIPYSYAKAQLDFEIKVGFDPNDPDSQKSNWKRKQRGANTAAANPDAPASADDARPHHHHHQQQPDPAAAN